MENQKRTRCEVWTRVMGYHRPVSHYNIGKKSELMDSFIFKYFVKDCWKVTERYHEHKRQALSLSSELKSMNKLGDELLSFIFLDEALERYELSIDKYLKNI